MGYQHDDTIQSTVEALNRLGLTVYEAKAYIALLRKSPLNGNEISRSSGVPGPKIYETLTRMTQKGLVVPLNTDPQLYTPLAWREFVKLRKKEFKNAEKTLSVSLEKIAETPADIALWQLTGYDALIGKAQEMIEEAAKDVLASLWHQEAVLLESRLRQALRKGVMIVTIQFGPEIVEIGRVYRHLQSETVSLRHGGELTLVVDGHMGLFMGQAPDRQWNGFWTTNFAVVRLMTNYIRHDIYSNKLLREFEQAAKENFGEDLQRLLNIELD
jgi:sugar-specific transcriptional regulator TrmB